MARPRYAPVGRNRWVGGGPETPEDPGTKLPADPLLRGRNVHAILHYALYGDLPDPMGAVERFNFLLTGRAGGQPLQAGLGEILAEHLSGTILDAAVAQVESLFLTRLAPPDAFRETLLYILGWLWDAIFSGTHHVVAGPDEAIKLHGYYFWDPTPYLYGAQLAQGPFARRHPSGKFRPRQTQEVIAPERQTPTLTGR
jgi:hypothetical protein